MIKSDLKVGMKVRIVEKVPKGEIFGGFVDEMKVFLGKVVTVSHVGSCSFGIKEDKYCLLWDFCLIDEIIGASEGVPVAVDSLQVGMSVRIVKEAPKGAVHGCFVEDMEEFLGNTLTIHSLEEKGFYTKENGWFWDYKLIDKILGFTKEAIKVGMKVKLRSQFVENGIGGYNPQMKALEGQVVTIRKVQDHCFRIEEEGEEVMWRDGFMWDYRNIEAILGVKVFNSTSSMFRHFKDFEDIEAQLPVDTDFKKVVINGLNVVAVVEAEGLGEVKAVAKCNPKDVFNAEKGLQIAVNRIVEIIAKERLRKLTT